jgi:hypothetical protein
VHSDTISPPPFNHVSTNNELKWQVLKDYSYSYVLKAGATNWEYRSFSYFLCLAKLTKFSRPLVVKLAIEKYVFTLLGSALSLTALSKFGNRRVNEAGIFES